MIAAIYARKSTEQTGVAEDSKSVTRQIEQARVYAAKKGWIVADEHIYSDDGVSGAEFVRRPGFIRLMASLKPKPPFQVLIMSEESRLGREQIKTAFALQQITEAGVRIWFYLTDDERKLDTAMDKIMGSLSGFASEIEREKAQQRTYDTMVRKARAGHVCGGRVFGYDNVDISSALPNGKRSHVELRINQAEAHVVLRVFRLYAQGHGFTSIAKTLNAEGAPCPRPRPEGSKPFGWAASSVRQVLLRRLYRGEQVWGRTKQGKSVKRLPEEAWIIIPLPHLQIVPLELWEETQNRWKSVRQLYLRATDGRLHGRPINGHESPYLLTGFTACKVCKGSLFIRSRSHGKQRAFHYACTTHYQRGPQACDEPMLIPMEPLDREILNTIERDVLHPAIVSKALEKAIAQLRPEPGYDLNTHREELQKDLKQVQAELARLATAIASGGSLTALLSAVQDRENRRTRLQAKLAALDGTTLNTFDPEAVERELRGYLVDWSGLAQRHPAQTRQVIRKLLPHRIRVWREVHGDEKCYRFEGEAVVGRFFSGLLGVKRCGVPNGIRGALQWSFRPFGCPFSGVR
jgi:site-specific DNA recombinase